MTRFARLTPVAENATTDPVQRVLDNRDLVAGEDFLAPDLSKLDPPTGLPDLAIAIERISTAIDAGELIGIITDHDVDGVTSHAVLKTGIEALGGRTISYIGWRLEEGYGLSDPLVDRMLADEHPLPDLIVTADHGSGDEPRIKRLIEEHGIPVIVTDHHDLDESGPPPSAFACISPRRQDSQYPDSTIAGCMVAWLTWVALVRHRGAEIDIRPPLDWVGVGTLADCVSMASINNRAVVRYAMARIASGARPAWEAAHETLRDPSRITSATLGFEIGPALNARGRLGNALAGVDFLTAPDRDSARKQWRDLQENNERRKEVDQAMLKRVMPEAAEQYEQGRSGIVVFDPEGHPGIHGIVASRILERTGRPTVMLSPHTTDPQTVTGSARGIEGAHIREAFEFCARKGSLDPGRFGGHPMAGGLKLSYAQVEPFTRDFDEAVTEQLMAGFDKRSDYEPPHPTQTIEGDLFPDYWNTTTPKRIAKFEPFGNGFPNPVYRIEGVVVQARTVGEEKTRAAGRNAHWKLRIADPDNETRTIEAIAFYSDYAPTVGERIRFAAEIEAKIFRGQESAELKIVAWDEDQPEPSPAPEKDREDEYDEFTPAQPGLF